MENKTFINNLSRAMGRSSHDVTLLIDALAIVIGDNCAELDAVALPGFGTFEASKTDEHISTDTATGRKMLMPPHVSISFKAGSRLKKMMAHE